MRSRLAKRLRRTGFTHTPEADRSLDVSALYLAAEALARSLYLRAPHSIDDCVAAVLEVFGDAFERSFPSRSPEEVALRAACLALAGLQTEGVDVPGWRFE